jgi:serine/threonine-protein kinase
MSPDRRADSLALAREVDALCDRFEEALRAGTAGDWWDWLPPVGPARSRALAELARLDLEHRLRAGEPVRVEAYLARCPELKQEADAVLALITCEYEVRRLREPELTLADYDPRFPELTRHLRPFDRPAAQKHAPSTLAEEGPGPEGACGAPANTQAQWKAGQRPHRPLSEQGPPLPDPGVPAPGGLDLRAYQLLERLGSGGLGEVYLSCDPGLNRLLALKVLRAEWQGDPDMERRFQAEARITGSLQHPAIVPVHNLGRLPDGRLYFTMKVVRGGTFAEMLAEPGGSAAEQAARLGVFAQVCQAVAYAHSKGVIHRDLKPENVMVGRFGEVQVLDWGLAKLLPRTGAPGEQPTGDSDVVGARSGEVAQTCGAVGTLAYMAPEQANGEWDRADERLDVFGLGGILCAVLTGQPPYVGASAAELRRKAQRGDLGEALARLESCGAEPDLVRLARACLCAEVGGRPRHAGEVARAVAAHQAALEQRLRQAELGQARAEVRAQEERKRRRLTAALALAGLAMLAALAAGGLWLQQQRSAQRQDVEALVEQAERLRRVGHFDECQELLGQASRRLGAVGPADLRQQVDGALADAALARRLDAARQREIAVVGGKLDLTGTEREYAAALAECGLAQEGEDAASVGVRVRASALREEVVAALDDWAGITGDEGRQEWLLAVARAADPDPDRDRLRQPGLWRDMEALARLAEREPAAVQSPQLATALARALRNRGGDAVPLLRVAQARHPDDFWLNYELGVTWHAAKEWGAAVGHFRAALALRPRAAAVHNNLGSALYHMGKLDEALGHYEQALRLDPKLALTHNNLALALKDKGKLEEAIGRWEQALRLDPKLAWAHINLGNALTEKGKLDEAVGHYQEALRLDTEHALTHNNLGLALEKQGKPDEAVGHYKEAVRFDPKFATAQYNLGSALEKQGKPDEALGHLRQAAALLPAELWAQAALRSFLLRHGRADEAQLAWRKALDANPAGHDAWFGYAELCLFLGREDEYRRARRDLLARFGNSTDPHVAERSGRAYLLLPAANDELRQAADLIDRAVAADPKTYGWARPYFLFARGLAEYRRDRFDAAVATLSGPAAVLRPAPGLVLAMALHRQGHPESARQALADAVLAYDWSASKADTPDAWICQVLRREAEALLLPDLPALLAGSRRPRDNAERLALLGACQFEGRHAAAARLYAGAFAADPKLAGDFAAGHCSNAARHAALAASGRGADAPEDDKDRSRLREQALDWLKADLTAWGKLAEGPAEERLRVPQTLARWRADPALTGVRDKDALAKLPEDERARWQELWGAVDGLLQRVGDKK